MDGIEDRSSDVLKFVATEALATNTHQTQNEFDNVMIFNCVLINPKWIPNRVFYQMLQNILSVLSCTDPFKTVTHDRKTSLLVDTHTFLEISQRLIKQSLDHVDSLTLGLCEEFDSIMLVITHVHRT